MPATVSVTVAAGKVPGRNLLAPIGIATPYETPLRFAVEGATFVLVGETHTGQMAALISPVADRPITLRYATVDGGPGYPEALFVHRPNRFTRPAEALAANACRIASGAPDGHAAISTIVQDAASKFTYGHPETHFHDALDEIPYLSCGMAEGSCVDINTFLIAALRAAGFEAGYVTGYFFPAEKNGSCEDMHCWVATRHDGVVREWDIAHHLKLGAAEIRPGLNPKPGARIAVSHSMGLEFPEIGVRDMKLLAEPVWIGDGGKPAEAEVTIRLEKHAA